MRMLFPQTCMLHPCSSFVTCMFKKLKMHVRVLCMLYMSNMEKSHVKMQHLFLMLQKKKTQKLAVHAVGCAHDGREKRNVLIVSICFAYRRWFYAAQQHASGRQGPGDARGTRSAARGCLTKTCRGQC